MAELGTGDLRRVLDLVYALNADEPSDGAPIGALAELGRLVGCDVASFTRVDHRTNRLVSAAVVPEERDLSGREDFHQVFAQHPGLAAYRSGRLRVGGAAAMSDLARPAELRRLPLYVDFYAGQGTVDQLLCMTTLDRRHGTNLAFNRSRVGFSDRDRVLVELVAPHFAQAMDRRARFAALARAAGQAVRHADRLREAAAALDELTPAERRVVDRLAGGLTDREIARCLEISPRTVHKHLENVYRKLGVTGRATLIALLGSTAARDG